MGEKERKQYERLVLMPVTRLIPRLAVPTVISMLITMIYNLVDAFFVGRLGTSASASISILASVHAVFQAIGFMFGHGSGSNISRALGSGDTETANSFATQGVLAALAVSVLPAILGLVFLEPLMTLLGSTKTILPYSMNYGFYILISGPALALSCVLNNILRYEGKAVYAMVGLVTGGVLNMIGDPILMFGLNMGIDGAGLSTAISQYISLAILGTMFLTGKSISRIRLKGFRWRWGMLWRVIRNGLPSLIRQVLASASTATLNISSKPYGDAAIAGMGIVGRIVMFMGAVMMGIGQGFQPVSAYNYGAKKYERIRRSVRFTWLSGEVVLGTLALIAFFFPEQIMSLFLKNPRAIQIGAVSLRFQCIALILQPFSVVSNMLFQSTGKSFSASFVASLRSGIYYIPLLLILPRLIGLLGIQTAQMISDILTTVTCIPFMAAFMRRLPRGDMRTAVDEAYEALIVQEQS